MGLSFRKSIKIGKLFNVNVGKTGVGLSAGVKGARVSVNKDGVGGSVGANRVRYSKRKSFQSMGKNNTPAATMGNSNIVQDPIGNNIKQNSANSYTRHITLLFLGFPCLFIGFIFLPLLFIGIILLISSLVCMAKNWKRINEEYKVRKNR